jgi:hypothetical protein
MACYGPLIKKAPPSAKPLYFLLDRLLEASGGEPGACSELVGGF